MMYEYLEAERLGESDPGSCSSAFSGCPVSLFNMMRTYSTPSDKPHDHQHSEAVHEEGKMYDESGGTDEGGSSSSNHLRVDMF